MSEPTVKLPQNADELLRDFPVAEPDFDAQAKAIETRLKGSPGGIVFDDLLRVPTLAAEPGEPTPQSSTRAAAPKSNFAEMARKSVQKSDDDKAQLTKELLAANASSRRPNAAMVERVRAAGRPAASSTPLPSSEPAERTSGVVARAAAAAAAAAAPAQAQAQAQPTKTHPGTIIGVIGAALALAAGVALFMQSGQTEAPTSAALAAEKAADAPGAGPHAAAPAPAAAAVKANDAVMSPEALAAAPQVAAPEAAKVGGVKGASGGAAAPAVALAAKAAAASSPGAKQEAVVLEDDPAPQKPAAAAPKAEAAPEPQLKPAEGSATDVPLSPSAGAVSTALSSVRGSAQACLAGQSDPVTAIVTFGASGQVLRVSAAGPSGPCIQAALMKAHIAPFAKESFTASTTIRPP